MKAEQIPAEVRAVFQKACDSGEPWNIADTISAAINAWPGMSVFPGMQRGTRETPPHIILPLTQENTNAES